ncbi:phosphate abc transporter substrate-binding protein [Haematococcus lacustris]|uniref:Phosphate abc transporter substrate-binding protein n=1 Tax=Haematococcus lacustris TaxID=44745 RepID=A0A699ZCR0_HAELA|nr:phosphate abc transporter substrate-binding protein [Haematococcus lacustris]
MVDFGVGTQPVTGTSLPGGMLHIPVAWHTVSLYTNILTASALQRSLNLTACLAAKLFSGTTDKWGTPEVADMNPGLSLVANVDTTVKVFAWLATCPASWSGSFASTAVISTNLTRDINRTPFALGYAVTYMAGSLPEAALACRDGGYVTAPQANATNTLAALASQLPASYDQTFASVSTINMAGERVSPLTQLDYLYLPKDVTSKGDRGAFLQGLARMALSAEGQALISGSGLRPLGNSVIASTGR